MQVLALPRDERGRIRQGRRGMVAKYLRLIRPATGYAAADMGWGVRCLHLLLLLLITAVAPHPPGRQRRRR